MTNVGRLLGRRLLYAAATLLVVSMVLFAFVEVLPGDAASRSLGEYATEQQVAAFRDAHGLDGSVPERYVTWLGNSLQGTSA